MTPDALPGDIRLISRQLQLLARLAVAQGSQGAGGLLFSLPVSLFHRLALAASQPINPLIRPQQQALAVQLPAAGFPAAAVQPQHELILPQLPFAAEPGLAQGGDHRLNLLPVRHPPGLPTLLDGNGLYIGFHWGFGPLDRVGHPEKGRQAAGQHSDRRQPEGGLFVAQNPPDPGLDAQPAKGQRPRRLGTAAIQQRLGIAGNLFPVHPADHLLVAGQLQIPAQQEISGPNQGIKPMETKGQPAQGLGPMIPPPDVALLMGQHIVRRLRRQIRRQINPGPDQPQHKGGIRFFGPINVVPPAAGVFHPSAQPPGGKDAPSSQRRGAGQPDPGQNSGPARLFPPLFGRDGSRLPGFRFCFRLRRRGLGQRRVDRAVEDGNAAANLNRRNLAQIRRDSVNAGRQAPGVDRRRGAQQPQPHQGPKEAEQPPRRPAQQEPQRHRRQNQPRGGQTHVENRDKQSFHVIPPCIGRSSAGSPPPGRGSAAALV